MKENVEFVVVLFPVKPSAKVPPVGASWLTCARASVKSLVFTFAPTSVEVAGCSVCDRETEALTSGSKMP